MRPPDRFLTAQWLNLALVNFEIDPRVLAPLVPCGTELDPWCGSTLVSLVGFEFRDARLWGLAIPFHRNFVEVNLRFYVRRRIAGGWRRGVVFVKELVPRLAVAWTARTFYGEHFSVAHMRHHVQSLVDRGPRRASFEWQIGGNDYRLSAAAAGPLALLAEGSEAQFVIEHYWGYSGRAERGRPTLEYRVEHRPWLVAPAGECEFAGDVARLYGPSFVEALSGRPTSALLVDGSTVAVYRGTRLAEPGPGPPHPDELQANRYTGRIVSA